MLGRLPAAHGMAATQAINVVILNGWFLTVFVGTAHASVAALFAAEVWSVAGSVLYLGGTFVVTMLCNAPRHDRLAAVKPWRDYLSSWTAWNHVRAASSVAAAIAFAMAP